MSDVMVNYTTTTTCEDKYHIFDIEMLPFWKCLNHGLRPKTTCHSHEID